MAYCPPIHNITTQQFKQFLTSLDHNFIVGRDFNEKHPHWGCRTSNSRRNNLLQLISPKQYQVYSPPLPTYWPTSPNKLPDILDLFISKAPNHLYHVGNFNDFHSDHSAVLLTINSTPPISFNNPYLVNKNTDWVKFNDLLLKTTKHDIQLKSPDDIEDAITNLTTAIQCTAWNSTTLTKNTQKPLQLNLPTYIRKLMTEKRRARSFLAKFLFKSSGKTNP